jgi:ABC-type Na+ transport system ATPase subunit NatA
LAVASHFPSLFRALARDNQAQGWNVADMVLSLKSLDQVFFRICQGNFPDDSDATANSNDFAAGSGGNSGSTCSSETDCRVTLEPPPGLPRQIGSGDILNAFATQGHRSLQNVDRLRQVRCIFRLRFLCAIRQYSTILLFFLPAFMIGISEIFSSSLADYGQSEEVEGAGDIDVGTAIGLTGGANNADSTQRAPTPMAGVIDSADDQRTFSFVTYLALSLCYSAGLYASRIVKDREKVVLPPLLYPFLPIFLYPFTPSFRPSLLYLLQLIRSLTFSYPFLHFLLPSNLFVPSPFSIPFFTSFSLSSFPSPFFSSFPSYPFHPSFLHFLPPSLPSREKGHRNLLRIATCSTPAYWIGNLCADWTLHGFSVVTTLIVVFLLAPVGVVKLLASGPSLVVLVTFGADIISFSYLFTLVFEKADTALRWVPLMLMMMPVLGVPVVVVLAILNLATVESSVMVFALVSPLVSFIISFVSLLSDQNSHVVAIGGGDEAEASSTSPLFAWNVYAVIMLFRAGVTLAMSAHLELGSVLGPRSNATSAPLPTSVTDEDVLEQEHLASSTISSNAVDSVAVCVLRLSKFYKEKCAVRNVSLVVERNEVFGILGPNGAGKTSLMDILCQKTMVSCGNVVMNGVNMTRGECPSCVGVVSQDDILWNQLTCKEHLEIFACLKGLPSDHIAAVVRSALLAVGLDEGADTSNNAGEDPASAAQQQHHRYADTCAKVLSGGNKRKLSSALAFLGSPDVVLLDEVFSCVEYLIYSLHDHSWCFHLLHI